jgi:hypothetical protein
MAKESRETRTPEVLRELTAVIAGLAAAIYLTGGLVLYLRLGLRRLPSTAVVSQLPREFLISIGLAVRRRLLLWELQPPSLQGPRPALRRLMRQEVGSSEVAEVP